MQKGAFFFLFLLSPRFVSVSHWLTISPPCFSHVCLDHAFLSPTFSPLFEGWPARFRRKKEIMALERIRKNTPGWELDSPNVCTYMYVSISMEYNTYIHLFCLSSLAKAEGGRQARLHSNLNRVWWSRQLAVSHSLRISWWVNIMHPSPVRFFLSLLVNSTAGPPVF